VENIACLPGGLIKMSGKYTWLVRDLLLFVFFVVVVDLESACAYASSMIENEASRCSGTVADWIN
jgi:hypothetical protein